MKATVFTSLLLMLCCSPDTSNHNTQLMAEIDQMAFNDTIWEIEISVPGNHRDTISEEKVKKDSEGNILYSEKLNLVDSIEYISYYNKDGDVLFQHTESLNSDWIHSTYETFMDADGKISHSTLTSLEAGEEMVIEMDYHYQYGEKGKLKNSTIETSADTIKALLSTDYTDFEKPAVEAQIVNNDTISKTTYYYSESTLEKAITIGPNKQSQVVWLYNAAGKAKKSEKFIQDNDGWIKTEVQQFFYDEDQNLIKTVETNVQDHITRTTIRVIS